MSSATLFKAKVPGLMRQFIADFDCSVLDAAAVFGNAGHECAGFLKLQETSPTVPGSRGGYGWFQWTGPRRRSFEAYCQRNKLNPASDEANYKFLFVELNGDEQGAIPALKKAREVRDANGKLLKSELRSKVEAFELAYERAGVKHYDSRLNWANIALGAYEAKQGAVTIPPPPDIEPIPPKEPSWLDALLNAVLTAFRRK